MEKMTEEQKKQAKEEAERLVDKYRPMFYGRYSIIAEKKAKMCALIAVDEILDDDMYGMEEEHFEKRINYWEEVKQEIENI